MLVKVCFLVLLLILFSASDILSSPWIPKQGQFQIINSWQKNIIHYIDQESSLESAVEDITKRLEVIRNNAYLSQEAKKIRLEILGQKRDELYEILKDKSFFDIWANNLYFEYAPWQKASVGFSFFSQARNLRPKQYYIALFSKFNFIKNSGHILSGSCAIGFANIPEFKTGISYGHSWVEKKLQFFSSIEPSIVISDNKLSRMTIDFTNGVKLTDSTTLMSQTIYERNLGLANSKFQNIFREKFSFMKELEILNGRVVTEIGFWTNSYLKKNNQIEAGIVFSIWYSG